MIISVISPRRGLGQTTTTINIAATISKLQRKHSVIIDTDTCFSDVEYYLSSTYVTKGLDDFCSLYRSNLISNADFSNFSSKIHEYINIMSANKCYVLSKEEIRELCSLARKHYSSVLIDTTTATKKDFIELSDWIVVLLNQSVSTIQRFMEFNQQLIPLKDRIVFVVNFYNESSIKYRVLEIKKNLEAFGFLNKVFILPFEPLLLNDANENSMLNFTVNNNINKSEYLERIADISKFMLGINERQAAVKDKKHGKSAGFNSFFCNRFSLGDVETIIKS